jgi:lambda family phage portal protein
LRERFARALGELTGRGHADADAAVVPVSLGAPSPPELVTRSAVPPMRRMQQRSAFRGAEVSRLLADWIAWPMAPDIEMRGDLRLMRGRARELARNNAHIQRYSNLLKTNVLGVHGMKLQAQVRDAAGELDDPVNELIEDHWDRWASGPVSADGRLPLTELAQLALETTARDGESFARYVQDDGLNPYGLSLQLIDADLVDDYMNVLPGGRQPEIRLGVEIDAWGRRTGYWIREQYGYSPGTAGATFQQYRLDASEVMHLYRPTRPNQTRGVTWYAAAMLPLQHLQGYTEAELIAARTAAAKMGFILTKDPSAPSGTDDDGSGNGARPVELEANPGSIEELDPGQEFASWDPTHPSTAFPAFVKSVLREIATALGVSYNALANDLEGVNFSSMRAGMQIERDFWQVLQQWWAQSFMQPVYERWLNNAILTRALPLPRSDWRLYTACRWGRRRWAYVNPKEDLEATAMAISLGLTSRTRVLSETSDAEFDEVIEELASETKAAKAAGVDVAGYSTGPGATAQPAPPNDGGLGGEGTADGSSGDGSAGDGGKSATG